MAQSIDDIAPKNLIAGYRRFRSDRYQAEEKLYAELTAGQQPHTLVIGCADSRVDPALVFDCGPGELFVVRNVANLAPAYEGASEGSVASALEYAVKVLGVKNVVVLGHKQCGGVAACAGGLSKLDFEFVGPWLEIMEPARCEVEAELGGSDVGAVSSALELRSVYHSVRRLADFPFIDAALKAGTLELHGARFGIDGASLEWMDPDGRFQPVGHTS
jgi:carbonic anhydrase